MKQKATKVLGRQDRKKTKKKNRNNTYVHITDKSRTISVSTLKKNSLYLKKRIFNESSIFPENPMNSYLSLKSTQTGIEYKMHIIRMSYGGDDVNNIQKEKVTFVLHQQGFRNIEIPSDALFELITKRNENRDHDIFIDSSFVNDMETNRITKE